MTIKDLKILLCDDSVFARKNIKDYLYKIGINQIFEASDGIQAVEHYKNNKPNLVLMDIIMPKLSGIDAVKQIIQFDNQAKIVMASSVGTQDYLRDAVQAGAFEFLQKPIATDLLYKILENLVKGE